MKKLQKLEKSCAMFSNQSQQGCGIFSQSGAKPTDHNVTWNFQRLPPARKAREKSREQTLVQSPYWDIFLCLSESKPISNVVNTTINQSKLDMKPVNWWKMAGKQLEPNLAVVQSCNRFVRHLLSVHASKHCRFNFLKQEFVYSNNRQNTYCMTILTHQPV